MDLESGPTQLQEGESGQILCDSGRVMVRSTGEAGWLALATSGTWGVGMCITWVSLEYGLGPPGTIFLLVRESDTGHASASFPVLTVSLLHDWLAAGSITRRVHFSFRGGLRLMEGFLCEAAFA